MHFSEVRKEFVYQFYPSIFRVFTLQNRIAWTPLSNEDDQRFALHFLFLYVFVIHIYIFLSEFRMSTLQIRIVWTPFSNENDHRFAAHLFC